MAAFGPGSPYQQYSPLVTSTSPEQASRSPMSNAPWLVAPQTPYAYGSLPMTTGASALPLGATITASRVHENTPLNTRNGTNKENQESQDKPDAPLRSENINRSDSNGLEIDGVVPLSKRNTNIPIKVKVEYADKSGALRELGSNSITGSSTSSPTKGTPSKTPKVTHAKHL
jgi:hypothetical protein